MTEKIEYQGIFDISQILSAIKQVKDEVSKGGDVKLLEGLDKEIEKVRKAGEQLKAQAEKGFSTPKELKAFEREFEKLETNIIKVQNSLNSISADTLKKQLKDIEKESIKLAKNFANTFKTDSKYMTNEQSINFSKDLVQAIKDGKTLEEIQKIITAEQQKQLEVQKAKTSELEKEKNILTTRFNSQLSTASQVGFRTNNFIDTTTSKDINLQQLNQIKEKFKEIISSAENAEEATKQFMQFLSNNNIAAKNNTVIENKITSGLEKFSKIAAPTRDKINDINNELASNSEITKKVTTDINNFTTKLKENEDAAKESEQVNESNTNAVNGLKKQTQGYIDTLKKSIQNTQQAANSQQNFNNTLAQLKNRIAYIFSLGNAYYQLRNIIRKTFSDVQSLDKAFASIAMVTDKTVAGLWDTYSQYTDIANRLGQSTESAIKASALFYQQGLDTNEALKLTEDTMKLATLAGADFETATQQMTAALRGFHLEMDQGAHVTDVYSELAANAAADVNGIAYAMSKTASIASSAGMSFESTAAFLTNMIETTQEAPKQKLIA